MGWLYNYKNNSYVFVLKTQPLSEHLNGVGATEVIWYDETSESWQISPLSDFRPPLAHYMTITDYQKGK